MIHACIPTHPWLICWCWLCCLPNTSCNKKTSPAVLVGPALSLTGPVRPLRMASWLRRRSASSTTWKCRQHMTDEACARCPRICGPVLHLDALPERLLAYSSNRVFRAISSDERTNEGPPIAPPTSVLKKRSASGRGRVETVGRQLGKFCCLHSTMIVIDKNS